MCIRVLFFGGFAMSSKLKYFSKAEWTLWISSVVLIVGTFVLFHQTDYLSLAASLIGATSLILNAKGNPLGLVLGIAFSLLYGYISYTFSYYGEMLTYLGMTAPMSLYALVCWLRHPSGAGRAEVKVGSISRREALFALILSAVVTVVFYFILRAFHTANLLPSTISVTTSFLAVYLTARRSPLFAVAYAANDLVLILLWGLATLQDASYLSVVVCFVMFFANDILWIHQLVADAPAPGGSRLIQTKPRREKFPSGFCFTFSWFRAIPCLPGGASLLFCGQHTGRTRRQAGRRAAPVPIAAAATARKHAIQTQE